MLIFAGIVSLILIGVLFFVGIWSVRAAYELEKHKGYKSDNDFKTAHTYLTWSSVIAWLSIGFILLAIVLLIVGAVFTGGTDFLLLAGTLGSLIYIFLLILIILVLACGVLTAAASVDMKKSPNFKNTGELKKAYDNAIYASVASLATLGILIIGTVFYYYYRQRSKSQKSTIKKKSVSSTSQSSSFDIGQIKQALQANPDLLAAFS